MIPKNKKLIIFDFDETLCKTNGLIKRVKHTENGEIEDFLTPGEYSIWRETGEYNLNPKQWDLDFKSFTGYPNEGEIIPETFALLRRYLEQPEIYIVALVTGRDELSGPYKFLEEKEIEVKKMIFLCSGDPNKRMCYESLFNTLHPSSVLVYEDAKAYITQCEEICLKYDIPFDFRLIGDGTIRWDWKL
ncbi:MAG: hypothetical protein CBC29_05975 [Methylococcaceae bacterium TMED69]|nr:MAG: hypothetical protein CBC29_05975 [Methylococcaceae bacterium TMED69]|tara:strand:+ start:1039 stop:1605 length:567 start_codon:yes stop_codon:yes gene_type:complete